MQTGKQLKILASVTAAGLLLTSCGSSGGEENANEDRPFEGETVSILMVQEEATEDLRDVQIPQFEEETGITVNVDLLPEAGMETKMTLALSGNTGEYDVVETGAKSWSQLVSSDWIVPVDEYMEQDPEYSNGFDQQLLESLAMDGNLFAVPYQVGANMLFYNKSMFEEAGLDPENPPNTLDELIEAAKVLHKPDENQYGIVSRGTREGNANSFSWIMMWFLNGGRWADSDGEAKYDVLADPEAVETTKQYKELMQYAPEGIGSYNFTEAQVAMQQGEAAMWLDAAQLGPSLEDPDQSTVAGDVGYHLMEGEGDDYVVGPVWGFSMTNTAQNPDAAWELMKFLTSKETKLEQTLAGVTGSPGRSDVLGDPAIEEVLNPEFAAALVDAASHVNPRYTPLIPQGSEIRAALSVALSEVLSGSKEPEQAMKDANEEVVGIVGSD